MKSTLDIRNIQSNIGHLETNEFSIAVNSKSFKVLLDTLYSDKALAIVRELSTNAYDAQIMAGNGNIPFLIHIPTVLAPEFYVRDYGVSMTHEEIMFLYTTVFRSSKDDSNEVVGMLGLGSKSPFAYGDSFSVQAFLNGEVRTYLAGMNEKNIPQITLIDRQETSEKDGLKVSLPVKMQNFNDFKKAVQKVIYGFDILPEVVNTEIVLEEIVRQGKTWRLYKEQDRYQRECFIRQGCVLYPPANTNATGSIIGRFIVDVPIGTVDVAANREALSFDDRTKEFAEKTIKNAKEELVQLLRKEIEQQPDIVSACKKFSTASAICTDITLRNIAWRGQTISNVLTLDLVANNIIGKTAKKWEDIDSLSISINRLDEMKFYIDRTETRIVRKRKRLAEYLRSANVGPWDVSNKAVIIQDPTKKDIDLIKKSFGAEDKDFIEISSLPDVLPTVSASLSPRQTVTRTGVYTWEGRYLVRVTNTTTMPKDYYWLPIVDGHSDSSYTSIGYMSFSGLSSLLTTVNSLEETDWPVYLLTPLPQKTEKKERELTLVFKKALEDKKEEILSINYQKYLHAMCKGISIPRAEVLYYTLFGNLPTGKYDDSFNHFIVNAQVEKMYRDEIDLSKQKVDKLIKQSQKEYPMLWPGIATKADYLDYVKTKQEEKGNKNAISV